eukprot:1485420-Prorocentrum_lima.AAC.1
MPSAWGSVQVHGKTCSTSKEEARHGKLRVGMHGSTECKKCGKKLRGRWRLCKHYKNGAFPMHIVVVDVC